MPAMYKSKVIVYVTMAFPIDALYSSILRFLYRLGQSSSPFFTTLRQAKENTFVDIANRHLTLRIQVNVPFYVHFLRNVVTSKCHFLRNQFIGKLKNYKAKERLLSHNLIQQSNVSKFDIDRHFLEM